MIDTEPLSPDAAARKGVLLVNLGSPASPAVADVRRYLREFLSDPCVVDLPRWIWLPLLKLVILPSRSPKSAHAYSLVWTDEGAPLVAISRRQAAKLQASLGPDYDVELAMRYGEPSIASGLEALRARGSQSVLLLPMFPQYTRATSGSVEIECRRVLAVMSAPPSLEVAPPWYALEEYIAALAERAHAAVSQHPVSHWVFSFHGLPQRYVTSGDPYRDECESTARALAARMNLGADEWTLVFQSRFGPEPWLQPYADVLVPALAATHKRVAIAMPGFVADCLETIEEIGIRLRDAFLAAGGEELVVVPCVNDSDLLVEGLTALVRTGRPTV